MSGARFPLGRVARDHEVGLCANCSSVRIVKSRTNSVFYLCERSRDDPGFPRYPRLPLSECAGYLPREGLHLAAE